MKGITHSLFAALVAFPAVAAPAVDVAVSVEREVTVVDEDGRTITHREPVRDAAPGEILVYTLSAVNVGTEPARATRLDDPIPAGTELIPSSVETGEAAVLASLDGGASWDAFPRVVERAAEDGETRSEPAPPSAYTHLRWVLPGALEPGERRSVTFKVRIQ